MWAEGTALAQVTEHERACGFGGTAERLLGQEHSILTAEGGKGWEAGDTDLAEEPGLYPGGAGEPQRAFEQGSVFILAKLLGLQ